MENIEESDVDLPFEGFNKTLYPIVIMAIIYIRLKL